MIVRRLCLRQAGRRVLVAPLAPRCARSRGFTTSTTTTTTTTTVEPPDTVVTATATAIPGSTILSSAQDAHDVAQSEDADGAEPHISGTTYVTRRTGPQLGDISKHYRSQQRLEKIFNTVGAKAEQRHDPLDMLNNPPRPEDVTLEMLMAAQTHMGHHRSMWNPLTSRYIYGTRQGIHIISLEQTAAHLRRAARVVEEVAYKGGLILFVGTRKGQMPIVAKAAELAGACQLFTKWTPGNITNRDLILGRQALKVVDEHDQTMEGFDAHLNTLRPLMPDLVICLNPIENFTMLYECGLQSIPTIGVIDTNANPSWVTYTIPANDDSLRSLGVIAGVLGRAGEKGRQRRLEAAKKGYSTWEMDKAALRFIQETSSDRRSRESEHRFGSSSLGKSGGDDEIDREAALLGLEEDHEEVSEEDMLDMLAQAQEKAIANLDVDEDDLGAAKKPAQKQKKATSAPGSLAPSTETQRAEEKQAGKEKPAKRGPTQEEIDAFWNDRTWFGQRLTVVGEEGEREGRGERAGYGMPKVGGEQSPQVVEAITDGSMTGAAAGSAGEAGQIGDARQEQGQGVGQGVGSGDGAAEGAVEASQPVEVKAEAEAQPDPAPKPDKNAAGGEEPPKQ